MAKGQQVALKDDDSLVAVDRFIQATRDSGYKGTSSAIAELVDNALQADSTKIIITIVPDEADDDGSLKVEIVDNGAGMDRPTLQEALRFGGTTRFNDRTGLGRYGMGLPNSSLSQARRVDVYTWQSPESVLCSYLDVDDIVAGRLLRVPKPISVELPRSVASHRFRSGTAVVWRHCDRLDHRKPSTIAKKLHPFLGRVFRYFLWKGVHIEINSEPVRPIDPLFAHQNSVTQGGRIFKTPLEYDILLPRANGGGTMKGKVSVNFTELPVNDWHHLSNEEKAQLGLSKGAGASIVRADREIEYGWFFMGDKRKENYDDWWRCEIRFAPQLDEAFGITHTKQQIRPSLELLEILVPDMEATAKVLNRRVREAHERLKVVDRVANSEAIAEKKDTLLPPLPSSKPSPAVEQAFKLIERRHPRLVRTKDKPQYAIIEGDVTGHRFFQSYHRGGQVVLALNTEHPFYKRLYRPLCEQEDPKIATLRQKLDLVLLAAARAESSTGAAGSHRFLETWGQVLSMFLGGQ